MRIAQDTQNTDLWANGVGRIALLFMYWGQPQQALPFLHEAQTKEIHNQRLKPWLSAIEAEIHAMRGNVERCQRALEKANSKSQHYSDENTTIILVGKISQISCPPG